ncbi:acyltransferase family protein [Cellulomonas edaphi]|uniref:Acyltransferase family protein n=1 Tax=Cellulomonas edaphi TaxID=3053468 RepID=A0ABT7S810_9CELL|nr:acyltransferase family protein [Cellulomons edaphi]MDM7831764.1 acyltransferase family protein [Cellulomons edaphi]
MVSPPPTMTSVAPSGERSRTAVLPEIQGLRAIAVMLVVLYHLWPKRLTGGYIGVDVFFVISGFLITGHLLRESERSGRVQFAQFWARRARRLLPASLLVLVVSLVATVVWVPTALWEQYAREIGAAGFYVLNWVLAADSVDYLAADNSASPALHYWSLSVEEQFYLVWPVLVAIGLALALRARRRPAVVVGAVLAVVTVASFVYSLHLTEQSPARAYFVTPVRAWQFGAGALLALVVASPALARRWERMTAARAALSWAGVLVIAWGAYTFTASTPFPGTAALVPVVGAVAVMAAGSPPVAWSPSRLLALRPAQVLGDISYSTYLWHWPPIVILPFVLGHALGASTKLVLLAAVLVLAWATKRWVEDPVRTTARWGIRRPRTTFVLMLVGMLVLAGGCVVTTRAAQADARAAVAEEKVVAEEQVDCFGAPSMDPDKPQCPTPELANMVVPDPSRVSKDTAAMGRCWVDQTESELRSCTFPTTGADPALPHIAFVGDSHAYAWLPAFVDLAREGKITIDTYIKGSCAWSTALPDKGDDSVLATCRSWRKDLEARLLEKPGEYDAVVTAGYSVQPLRTPKGVDEDAYREDGSLEAWTPVMDAGIPVIALRDNPIPGKDPNECLRTTGRSDHSACDLSRTKALEHPDPQVGAVARSQGRAQLVDLTDMYCDATTCPVVIGGANVYRDKHHVTTTYLKTLTPYLWRQLDELLG